MQEKTIGERVNQIRKQKGWSMHQLAERVGTTHSYISQLEHDRIRPGIDLAIRLADAFGVSIDYLVGRAKPGGGTADSNRLAEEPAAYTVGEGETAPAPEAPAANPLLEGIQEDLSEIARYDPGALEYISSIIQAVKEKVVRDHQEQQRTKSDEPQESQTDV